MYISIHSYKYTHIEIHTYIYIHIYMCISVYMYACMHMNVRVKQAELLLRELAIRVTVPQIEKHLQHLCL